MKSTFGWLVALSLFVASAVAQTPFIWSPANARRCLCQAQRSLLDRAKTE